MIDSEITSSVIYCQVQSNLISI